MAEGTEGRSPSRHVAWQAAFVLGIAFTQVDEAAAVAVLGAALGGPPERSAVRRHLWCLSSVDDVTRRRALTLLDALDDDAGRITAGATGQPA